MCVCVREREIFFMQGVKYFRSEARLCSELPVAVDLDGWI